MSEEEADTVLYQKRGAVAVMDRPRTGGGIPEGVATAPLPDIDASIRGAEIAFEYAEPFENYPPETQANLRMVAERAASIGEPWLSLFNPPDMAALMRAPGPAVG